MSVAVSVSKGVFIFKNGAKAASKKSKKSCMLHENLLSDSLWHQSYQSLWTLIEKKIQKLRNEIFTTVVGSLIEYIDNCYDTPLTEVPTAVLLTGVNMPDHSALFTTLSQEIRGNVTRNVVTLNHDDCSDLKHLVESLVQQLVNEIDSSDEEDGTSKVKKSHCNFSLVQTWYEESGRDEPIVVIIPEFEAFSVKAIQDFILIAASYINVLPFILIFGVATSITTIHSTLPYHISSKINIQVFNSTPSIVYLNKVLENILFSPHCPFALGGKVFNLFMDIFLFYDMSVSGFIQNFKYAMIEHFTYGNAMALCRRKNFSKVLNQFTENDCENARRLISFRKMVEREPPEIQIKLLTDDNYLKSVLKTEVKKIVKYMKNFHLLLKCLHILVGDLPRAPLGKQVRELYSVAASRSITQTQEFKECLQLLLFQSREELTEKLTRMLNHLAQHVKHVEAIETNDIMERLVFYRKKMDNLDDAHNYEEMEVDEPEVITGQMNRQQLKEALLQMSKFNKPLSKYEKIREETINYLKGVFENFLMAPNDFIFHEIFFFDDISVKSHIVGSHRAAIHTALNDPHLYLRCSCCEISDTSTILRSMPDVCIAYKLHLECGKMINLYDWLQAFISIVDPQSDEEKIEIKPEIQARFTQAVTELEFLGFVKSSKRKTDHVARLTWGG